MGAPRASTDRQRWAGKMCCNCHRALPEPHTPGEKFCPVCKPVRRVLMSYEWRAGLWFVVYRQLGIWPFPRTDRFQSPGTIRDIYERFGTAHLPVDREAFEFGLQTGRGLIELQLTPEQYQALSHPDDLPL